MLNNSGAGRQGASTKVPAGAPIPAATVPQSVSVAPSHADPEASIIVLLGSPAATAPRVHRQGRRLAAAALLQVVE